MRLDADRLRAAYGEACAAVGEAAVRSGRRPDAVEVVLAGKYVPAGDAPALVAAGIGVVGENRLQDLEAKRAVIGDAVVWDFIGHLQRRKARAVLPVVRRIHSLDSLELAQEIDRRASGPVDALLQVNIAAEPSKRGIVPDHVRRFVEAVGPLANIVLGGLMALPPAAEDPERSRPYFAMLRELNEQLASEWAGRHRFADLSMGTSQDFAVAAEEGATQVRIGRSMIDRSLVS